MSPGPRMAWHMHSRALLLFSAPVTIRSFASATASDFMPQEVLQKGAWRSANHSKVFGKRDAAPKFFKSRLSGWLVELLKARSSKQSDIYEFGVYTGMRMRDYAQHVKGFGHLWGFDSFTGFPDEKLSWVPSRHWAQGGDSASDALQVWKTSDLLDTIRQKIPYENTSFIVGYYNDSLTPTLRKQKPFQKALMVDLDCDLYISTIQALRWMFAGGLMGPRTVVRYDDWPGNRTGSSSESKFWRSHRGREPPPEIWGQMQSHIQATDEFQVEWNRLNRNSFEVVSIGQRARAALDAESFLTSCKDVPSQCDPKMLYTVPTVESKASSAKVP